jgi:hypothetical protein
VSFRCKNPWGFAAGWGNPKGRTVGLCPPSFPLCLHRCRVPGAIPRGPSGSQKRFSLRCTHRRYLNRQFAGIQIELWQGASRKEPSIAGVRIATFNLENFDETAAGEWPSLAERIMLMRPQILRLRADVACFQEVNGQERPTSPSGSRPGEHSNRKTAMSMMNRILWCDHCSYSGAGSV